MQDDLAEIVTPSSKASSAEQYDNHALANVNDHVVRISVMTQPYHRHFHPNSDETFRVVAAVNAARPGSYTEVEIPQL